MTNDDLTTEDIRVSFCPSCGEDYGIAVTDDDEIIIFCECTYHQPSDFIEDLEDQLPMQSISTEDEDDPRGFQ